MAHVIDQTYGRNRDLGQITDPNLLAYYAGIGYTIDGTSTGAPTTPPNPPAIVVPGLWAPSGASDGDLLTVEHGQIVTAAPAGDGTKTPLLDTLAVVTSTAALVAGKIKPFNATSGAIVATALPALSGLAFGATYAVQKTDSSANTVTVPFSGSDSTQDSATSIVLTLPGIVVVQAVNNPGGGKWWKVVNHVRSDATLRQIPDYVPLTRSTPATRRVPFLPNCQVPGGATSTSTAGITYRTNTFQAPFAASELTIRIANWYWGTTGENAGPQALTEKFYLEIGGVSIPFTFRGALSITPDAYGYIESDPIPLPIAAGDTYNIRCFQQAIASGNSTGGMGLQGSILLSSGGTFNNTSDLASGTGALGSAGPTSTMPYFMGVWATPLSTSTLVNAFVGVGDSIMSGLGDYINGARDASARRLAGWFIRAMGVGSGSRVATMTSLSGQTAATAASRLLRHRTAIGWQGQVGVVALGRNDITAGTSAATTLGYLSTVCTELANRGCRDIYVATIMPVTTSTDAWATTGNQTATSNNAARLTLNASIRAGSVVGATRVLELADIGESARDSGVWVAAGTEDGTHPSQAVHTSMATYAAAQFAAAGY